MAKLYFDPQSLPRNTTKAKWKEIYRWKRTVERQLARVDRLKLDVLQELINYGSSIDWITDEIINPPLILPPL